MTVAELEAGTFFQIQIDNIVHVRIRLHDARPNINSVSYPDFYPLFTDPALECDVVGKIHKDMIHLEGVGFTAKTVLPMVFRPQARDYGTREHAAIKLGADASHLDTFKLSETEDKATLLSVRDKQLEDMTPEELVSQFNSNNQLLMQMVGSLYPSIVRDEQNKIKLIYYRKTGIAIAN
jgi:hypothetical protein